MQLTACSIDKSLMALDRSGHGADLGEWHYVKIVLFAITVYLHNNPKERHDACTYAGYTGEKIQKETISLKDSRVSLRWKVCLCLMISATVTRDIYLAAPKPSRRRRISS